MKFLRNENGIHGNDFAFLCRMWYIVGRTDFHEDLTKRATPGDLLKRDGVYMERKQCYMLLGAFCLIAILVMGVLGCVSGSPIGGLAAKNVKPVPLTPMEQAQKDYASVTITYQIGDASEVLDSDRILSWLKENEDGSVTFDEQQAKAFVKSLAEKYDTAYTTRTFHTTSGHDIQITQGDYGWRIDQEAETAHLLQLLAAKESATCEPIYAQTAAVHAKNDWGTSQPDGSVPLALQRRQVHPRELLRLGQPDPRPCDTERHLRPDLQDTQRDAERRGLQLESQVLDAVQPQRRPARRPLAQPLRRPDLQEQRLPRLHQPAASQRCQNL